MSGHERFVAIGLLTQRDMDVLGSGFRRAFPLDDASAFDDLLKVINESSRRLPTMNVPTASR